MFAAGTPVTHPGIPNFGVAFVESDSADLLVVRHGKSIRKFNRSVLSTTNFRKATPEEAHSAKTHTWVSNHAHSYLVETMIKWLQEAGTEGVLNDCGCPKNQHWNYECECLSLLKVYHRFSVFVQQLRENLDMNIETVALESGKYKTILHPGSYAENKHKYTRVTEEF